VLHCGWQLVCLVELFLLTYSFSVLSFQGRIWAKSRWKEALPLFENDPRYLAIQNQKRYVAFFFYLLMNYAACVRLCDLFVFFITPVFFDLTFFCVVR